MEKIEVTFHGDKKAFENKEFAEAFSSMVKRAYNQLKIKCHNCGSENYSDHKIFHDLKTCNECGWDFKP